MSICDKCWKKRHPTDKPVRHLIHRQKNCKYCGMPTISGIVTERVRIV